MEALESKLAELYELHDTVFLDSARAKQEQLQARVSEIEEMVEALGPIETNAARARVAYIHGRALSALEAYSPLAEELLSRAVKLEPGEVDAWNGMGECLWKKGDLSAAMNCFNSALEQEPNKETLRHMSQLLRCDAAQEDPGAAVEQSVARAREAVGLDVDDGRSWYFLGNAYLALFFRVSHDNGDLTRALKAYRRAEEKGDDRNPDLYFNRATVLKFREEYDGALASFRRAQELDPTLNAGDEVEVIVRSIQRIARLVAGSGRVKPKRLQALLRSIAAPPQLHGRVLTPLAELAEGPNPGTFVAVKILVPVGRSNQPPDAFVVADRSACVAMSVYHISEDMHRRLAEQEVHVMDPCVRRISIAGLDGEPYNCVQVTDPTLLLADGQPLQAMSYAPAELKVDTFDH